MNILTLSGSARQASKNTQLCLFIHELLGQHNCKHVDYLHELPLFYDGLQNSGDNVVNRFRAEVLWSDLVIISSPEYIYNMPALLKNAMEWLTDSGEMNQKRTILIGFTPQAPRGEKLMQCLSWTISSLNAQVITTLQLYQNEFSFDIDSENESMELLKVCLNLI